MKMLQFAVVATAMVCASLADSAAQEDGGLKLPPASDAKPWSDQPVLNDPDRFHIAIMTDRTGGHRPGVWRQAVNRVNLMRPDFVMSVGDLIEGYTDDESQVRAEWQEFLGLVGNLEMKFFFVAGNHDLTNPMMHRIWREQFGREWYSFDYKGVHFICLCSEDPVTRLGEKQLQWLYQDLEQSRDARWTLVFLHKPLWVYAERQKAAGNRDSTNWKQVEQLLKDRNHTVFAGHVHHYVQYDRNGAQYFSLATTGGSSRLRGAAYGEFDHVVWLTMEHDGPRIANLMLDGVEASDVVTEQSIARFRQFLADVTFEVEPILIDSGNTIASGNIRVKLTNNFDRTVRFGGTLVGLPLKGLTLDPPEMELLVQPGEAGTLDTRFEFNRPIDLAYVSRTVLNARLAAEDQRPLRAELTKPAIIDRKFYVVRRTITNDGKLDEWSRLAHRFGGPADVYGAGENWQGPGDCSGQFAVAHDDQNLYVAVRVQDDQLLTDQDRVAIAIDPRPLSRRSSANDLPAEALLIEISPPGPDGRPGIRSRRRRGGQAVDAAVQGLRTETGFQFELAIPHTFIDTGAERWNDIQLAIAAKDIDEPLDRACWVSWRGARHLTSRNIGFGHFFKTEEPAD